MDVMGGSFADGETYDDGTWAAGRVGGSFRREFV